MLSLPMQDNKWTVTYAENGNSKDWVIGGMSLTHAFFLLLGDTDRGKVLNAYPDTPDAVTIYDYFSSATPVTCQVGVALPVPQNDRAQASQWFIATANLTPH